MVGKKTREATIEQMVALGYSREFAEAFVPMTVAEARAKRLQMRQYESAYSSINKAMSR